MSLVTLISVLFIPVALSVIFVPLMVALRAQRKGIADAVARANAIEEARLVSEKTGVTPRLVNAA
jgi:hypothetical protein